MTYTEIENAVYDWVTSIVDTSVVVIFENENGPRPSLPYISLNLFAYAKVGESGKFGDIGTDGIKTIRYDEDFTASIQGYGVGSNDLLQQLKNSLQIGSVLSALNQSGLVIREDNNPITNIAIPIDGLSIEKRYIYDVFFGTAQCVEEYVGFIEDVEINEGRTRDEIYLPPC